MKSYTDRTQEKTKRVADSISMPKNSGGAAFQFVDNRTAAVAQHKMTEAINTSPKQAAQGQQLHSLFGNTAQMQPLAEDELQMKTASKVLQKTGPEEEELLQGKFGTAPIQREPDAKPNSTGLPDNLKAGIENLSGFSMDDVKVHYNSPKPAQLQAHAYAQGTDIHLASGQEKHLPHEAWHVVQQRQGRVKPTLQMKTGIPVNDDPHLEKEADVMGGRAAVQCVAESSGFDPNDMMNIQCRTISEPLTQAHTMHIKGSVLQLGKKNKKFKNKDNEFTGEKNNNTHVHEYRNGGGHLKVNGIKYNLGDNEKLKEGIEKLKELKANKNKKNTKKSKQFFKNYDAIINVAKQYRKDDPDPDSGGIVV